MGQQTAEVWRRLAAESQGVYHVQFFTPFNLAALAAEAHTGNAMAAAQLSVVDQMLATINASQSPGKGPACLLCGSAIWRRRWPARIGVVCAECDVPTQAVANVICGDCERRYPTPQTFNEAVVSFYREHVMSDARVLQPASAPGHA